MSEEGPRCSCSPTKFTFRLGLSGNCNDSTITDQNPGISGSLCFFDEGSSPGASLGEITKVTSINFLEVDTRQLGIINQDSTYFSTDLPDGSQFEFTSISNQLDYMFPFYDQLSYVPGGVMVTLFGEDVAGNVVQNTVAWDYNTRMCTSEPLSLGDTIGWLTIVSYPSIW